jgi:leucyl aminopeptidase
MSIHKYQFRVMKDNSKPDAQPFDAIITVNETSPGLKDWKSLLPHLEVSEREALLSLVKRKALKPEAGALLYFDRSILERSAVVLVNRTMSAFKLLGLAKGVVENLKAAKVLTIRLDVVLQDKELSERVVDAFVSALKASEFQCPRYGSTSKELPYVFRPSLLVRGADKTLERVIERAVYEAEGTNLVRELAMLAGNDLTPKNYVARLRREAEKEGFAFSFDNVKKLAKLNAGAFLAVVQASPEEDAGLVRLTYTPKKKSVNRTLALVGKGITYDTGGTNLKSAAHMYGMHRDMAGSAVAYALLRLAAREQWPFTVTAYLAIADNLTGPKAYRPNDVVTAANGKTIEIVHTDAEGRMILADTLYFASQSKPDLILDFATLTGACVGAIGNSYSGAFTNRDEYQAAIIESGKQSGERVWPFPIDEDFGDCLKSEIADTKQCRLTGGVDHIEAAIFLRSFLQDDCPWVHIDLAAADHAGGLAHIDSEVTGFGVRFAANLIRRLFSIR